ncbi:MAG: AAA family ATPase [Deltaproteobacteria bacterium]|nr:AAA family ATPase [Deltaproteobacteria bacterium]
MNLLHREAYLVIAVVVLVAIYAKNAEASPDKQDLNSQAGSDSSPDSPLENKDSKPRTPEPETAAPPSQAQSKGGEAAVAGVEQAATKVASSTNADPVLVEIRDHLRLLIKGALPEWDRIDQLFSVDLGQTERINKRLQVLFQEKSQLADSLKRIQRRVAEPEKEVAKAERPAVLDSPPIAPKEPIPPEKPVRPPFPAPRGKKDAKRSAPWLERHDAWEKYRADLAAYEQALKQNQELSREYESRLTVYQEQKGAYDEASAAYQRATRERQRSITVLVRRLKREASNLKVRLDITNARFVYLKSLLGWLTKMPASALEAFSELKAPRVAVRDRAASMHRLIQAVARLCDRIETLRNRASAGSLVGFQVDRDQLVAGLDTITAALAERSRSLQYAATQLKELAQGLEQEGSALRSAVLAAVMNPKRKTVIDQRFNSELMEMRLGARNIAMGDFADRSGQEEKALVLVLDGLLVNPIKIGSNSEAKKALERVKAQIELIDGEIDTARLDADRYRQAFRREAVTVLSSLASPEAKNRAYSFSSGLIAELFADLDSVKLAFRSWGHDRWATILQARRYLRTGSGIIWLTRLSLAVLVLLVLAVLGRRISRFVALGIGRLSASSFFRHRVGALVRWAGLVEALLPTLLLAVAGYSVLALIGFDKTETRFVEVAVRWFILFIAGGKILEGLTRRVSRGRPALIAVAPEIGELLGATYSRLGAFVAIAVIVREWTRHWLGTGLLSVLVVWLAWLWVFGWALWAMFVWRKPIGEALAARSAQNTPLNRLAGWMIARRLAVVLTLPAACWIVIASIAAWVRMLLAEGGFLAYLQARSLRRRSRAAGTDQTEAASRSLPQEYSKEFPLYPIYGKQDAVLLPRENSVKTVLSQLERWRSSKQDASLVVIGEKGIGKTTFLSLLEKSIDSLPLVRYSISKKLRDEKALISELASVFGIDQASNVGMIAARINSGERRVVLLDEAHNVFLRTVDGYDAYEALVRLVNFTSDKIFWVLVFNAFSWAFINQSRKQVHYFRQLLYLPSWSRDEIQELIVRRNKKSGFEISFDEILLDRDRSQTGDFEVIDSAEGFFRLLWEASRGNPRVATYLWLNSLTALNDKRLRVGLFSEKSLQEHVKTDRELLFTLAAICQHENLSVAELQEVLNVHLDFAAFAIRYLTEYNLLEPKHTDPKRSTLSPEYYPQIIKLLRQNHLIFEKG